MTEHTLVMRGEQHRQLDFAVERIRDGAFYQPDSGRWQKPKNRRFYIRMTQNPPGYYVAPMPALDKNGDYCVHVVDCETQQLVVSQFVDGDANMKDSLRAGPIRKGPEPRNEYHGGFVMDIRKGRAVDLT